MMRKLFVTLLVITIFYMFVALFLAYRAGERHANRRMAAKTQAQMRPLFQTMDKLNLRVLDLETETNDIEDEITILSTFEEKELLSNELRACRKTGRNCHLIVWSNAGELLRPACPKAEGCAYWIGRAKGPVQ